MGIFGRKPKPPVPPTPPVPYVARLSVWANGQLNNSGVAVLRCDQYPGQAFAGVQDGPRWKFTLPPGTMPWGANLSITCVPDFQDYEGRCLVAHDITDIALEPAVPPFVPCDRVYRGNMCGIRVKGLPPVPGGRPGDPALVLSWFIDRYANEDRARIYAAYRALGVRDILVSWPDSRDYGYSPEQFGAFCQEVVREGFTPCVMLSSKYYDPHSYAGVRANVEPVLPYITKVAGRICVGWELSLWLSPADVQALTDWLAPLVNPWGGKLYVHFQQGYASFDFDGPNATFAAYWNRNVGKLTGVLHQRDLSWDKPMYQARLVDVLERFAGNFNCVPDSGFGHPFDIVALEITAQEQYDGTCSEAEGNTWGQVAINTPASQGPLGPVRVQGSGNGQ